MNLDLQGSKALISGATDVVGFACAEALASEGVNLALAGPENDALKQATQELRENFDVDVTSHSTGLANSQHQKGLVDIVGDVDFLVNNLRAGSIRGDESDSKVKGSGSIESLTAKQWQNVSNVNFLGCVNLCRLYHSRMRSLGGGVILNVIAKPPRRASAEFIAEASAAAALSKFTECLGDSFATSEVRSVGISVPTEVLESSTITDALVDKANYISDVVTFLVSVKAEAFNGTVIEIDA